MVAEIDQSQGDVTELKHDVDNSERLVSLLEEDLLNGRQQLRDLVASSDGFQQTADRDTALYHYQNTLCNIMRGGLPENSYALKSEQFTSYLKIHNSSLAKRFEGWIADLPEPLERDALIEKAKESGDLDLLRLAATTGRATGGISFRTGRRSHLVTPIFLGASLRNSSTPPLLTATIPTVSLPKGSIGKHLMQRTPGHQLDIGGITKSSIF